MTTTTALTKLNSQTKTKNTPAAFQSIGIFAILVVSLSSHAAIKFPIAGCNEKDFVTGTDNNAIVTQGMSYTPKCLKVKAGATVSIQGSSKHPLMAMDDFNGVTNPFSTTSGFISTQTRVLSNVGVFGFFCDAHGNKSGSGMAGAIIVE